MTAEEAKTKPGPQSLGTTPVKEEMKATKTNGHIGQNGKIVKQVSTGKRNGLAKKDSEIKVLLGCTDTDAETILAHHNKGQMAGILIPKPGT